MYEIRGDLEARSGDNEVEIGNNRVRARFRLLDGGYAQEFLAADRRGEFHLILSSIHKHLIPSSEHRAICSPMISGEQRHLFALTRDSLRMVYSRAQIVEHTEQRIVTELTGSALGHNLRSLVTIESDSDAIHIETEDNIDRGWSDPLVEYSMNSFAFLPDGHILSVGEQPDYTWAPSLRPADDHVIGDYSFHSPVAIVQTGQLAAALVPDLDLLGRHRPMQTCLDLDLSNGLLPAPLLSFGFCGYEQVYGGSYARHDMTHARRIPGSRLTYGCHLILDADCKRGTAHTQVARFLWKTYGAKHQPARSRNSAVEPAHTVTPDARAARGLYALGVSEDDKLIDQACSLVDTVLTAPVDRGLFPTRCDTRQQKWSGCQVDIGGAAYHTVECSTQLYWLLKWHESCRQDDRILQFCRQYADFLLGAMQRNGAIPSWYDRDHIPLSLSRSGVQTAPSAAFLALCAKITGEKTYAQAAQRSAKFVLKEIVPRRLFLDGSLLNTADRCALECPDPHTSMRPASGTALLWIAAMCLELGPEYLAAGRSILDELCLLQSVWTKPWAPEHLEHGSLAQGNVGAKHDPELTAEFARCAMQYGALTGEREYFERGAAALRSLTRAQGLNALTQARVAASIAEIESTFGAIYIHVARKWAVALDGWRVGAVDIESGAVSLSVTGGPVGGDGRIVFGGLRRKLYRVELNGQTEKRTREELADGIHISGPQPANHSTKEQLTLLAV